MKKAGVMVIVLAIVCGVILGTGTALAAEGKKSKGIAPNSPLYMLDRLAEKVVVIFMSDEKKANFYLKQSRERFEEAAVMQEAGDSERSFELVKEGLGSVGKSMKAWKKCAEKNINLDGLRDDLKEALDTGKAQLKQLSKELDLKKIGEALKELGELAKVQIEVFLNGE